jgi:hypothetical protein
MCFHSWNFFLSPFIFFHSTIQVISHYSYTVTCADNTEVSFANISGFSCQNLSHFAHGKIRTFHWLNGRMDGKAITLTSNTVKKSSVFYASWSFTGVFTKSRHWCLPWVTFRCFSLSKYSVQLQNRPQNFVIRSFIIFCNEQLLVLQLKLESGRSACQVSANSYSVYFNLPSKSPITPPSLVWGHAACLQ